MKKPGLFVGYLHWLQMLLVVALAGSASCNQTSAASAPTSVYYFLDVTVDVSGKRKEVSEIKDWLGQVFQNKLENCLIPNQEATTASPQTTSAITSSEVTVVTTAAATSQSNDTTTVTAPTTLESSNATSAAASTTLESSNATSAAASTTLESSNATSAAASTILKSGGTATTDQATTAAPSENKKPIVTPVGGGKDIPSKKPNANQSNKQRKPREIQSCVAQARRSKDTTIGLFQEIDVLCKTATAIKNTRCSVVLRLKQKIPPCCILRTLCAASRTSSDIYVVGKNADRIGQLQSECNSKPQEENSCTYTGPDGASCVESGDAYAAGQGSSNCGQDIEENVNCSCASYCSRLDAYYTFNISTQDPKMQSSYVLSLLSKLKQAPDCSPTTESSCPPSIFASQYKSANLTCSNTTNHKRCRVVLGFAKEVAICALAEALMNAFQSDKLISFDGLVTRAAICGNSGASSNPLTSPVTWTNVNLKPAAFCRTNTSVCQTGENVAVELEEKCAHKPLTTPSPNVTTAQPNTSTSSVNVTSSAPNATGEPLNATTTNASISVTPTTAETAESQAYALLLLSRNVSKLNSSQVAWLVSQLEKLLSGPTISLVLGNISIHIVSNLLAASPEKLAESSSSIIGIVDTVGLKLVLEERTETLLSPAVALSVKPYGRNLQEETYFTILDPNNVQVRGGPRLRRSMREDTSIPQGSIRLPPSLTQDLTSEQQQLASRVQFNFYQKSTVFQDRSLGQRKLNSGILGASVANLSITGLKHDVVIHLRNKEPIPANFGAVCVFWDFTFNNGSGGWNPNGCSVRNSTDNETVCGCNHLTSFAILLDLSRETLTNRVQATILTFITYIGCGISAIFLSVTLLTYLAFEKLRKDIPSKILIQLCLALLLLNLVFLVDAWLALYPDAVGLCISTAWFLHYFLLVVFTWMGLEAVHMYLALVKVFNSYVSRYMLKFSLVGWGVPMIVVIIVIAIDKDNYGLVSYGKFPDGTTDDFCWLRNDIAFYVAVVAYFCIIFLFNFIMFFVVLVQLCRIKRQNPHNMQHRTTLQDVRSVTGITILLGLTWGFAFFAWGPVNLPFMYLFAIFNSFQGFFIFLFHCAVKENVRKQWRSFLCCGKMRLTENSEWSRTATQKNAKKSSVTRLASSKSCRSNNSSSSSTFLVSDVSEHINGIGSPFDDRAITADEDPNADVVLNEINRQNRQQQAS